jgi:hypothetical protein
VQARQPLRVPCELAGALMAVSDDYVGLRFCSGSVTVVASTTGEKLFQHDNAWLVGFLQNQVVVLTTRNTLESYDAVDHTLQNTCKLATDVRLLACGNNQVVCASASVFYVYTSDLQLALTCASENPIHDVDWTSDGWVWLTGTNEQLLCPRHVRLGNHPVRALVLFVTRSWVCYLWRGACFTGNQLATSSAP